MKRRTIIINLLNFSDAQIAGTGIFARSLFRAWFRISNPPKVVIFHAASVDVRTVFGLTEFPDIVYQGIRVNGFLSRILYEQLLLPFHLGRFDLYFSPTPVMPLMSRFFNKSTRHIVTIHDMIPFFVSNKYGKIRSVYVKLISIYGARLANTVITVSENSKIDICSIAKVLPEKVAVVYNFIPSDVEKYPVRYERFFVSVSTIEPGKNIENTMLGFKRFIATAEHSDFKFYWIGKIGWGYTQSELDKMINDSGLAGKFCLLGYVDNDRKSRLLSECSAMVYLSHYEGFGLPVLEALQYDKPSVASQNSSLPEVVGKTGVLCNKEDADDIARALSEVIDDLDKYVRAIPEQVNKFSEQRQLSKFLQTIDSTGNE